MKAVLVMFKSDGKRREFPLKPGTHVIGRQKSCRLRVPLPSVSRRHAELIVAEDGGVTVRDLGSSNGTFRNGSRVEESPLEPGDELRIGPLDLILADGDEASETPVDLSDAAAATAATAGASASASGSGSAGSGPGPEADDGDSGIHDLGELQSDFDDDSEPIDLDLDLDEPEPSSASSSGASGSASPISIASASDAGAGAGAGAVPEDASDSGLDLDAESDAGPASSSGPVLPPSNLGPLDDEDDDDDLEDVLANFGKSDDSDGSSEFDFMTDIEVLDDDSK